MRFTKLFFDKAGAAVITFISWVIIMVLMLAFKADGELIAAVTIIYFAASILRLIIEYIRKHGFYSQLETNLSELDKKYLLPETLEPPSFAEGELIYEVMRETSKSMCENIAGFKRSSSDFREYIELWVHEIKLPISSLMLMCHNDGEQGEKYVSQLKRIDDYVENVLYYVRSENAEKDYVIKETSLKRTFTNIAMKHREDLLQSEVTLSSKGLDVNVMTDSKWLEYILGQLLSNSMKYFSADRTPEITVTAEEMSDRTELHFRDNGIGIPAADIPYIFEKSFTGANGRSRARSTGMGLYIVKSLCDRLGHSIAVTSDQGRYTEITITFGKNDMFRLGGNLT